MDGNRTVITHDPHAEDPGIPGPTWSMAAQATLHCLTGCAIGEVLGMALGTALGWTNGATVVASIVR